MFISALNKIDALQKQLAAKSALDAPVLKLLNDLGLENFLFALENEPFDPAQSFTSFCKRLKGSVGLVSACFIIYKTPAAERRVLKPARIIKFGELDRGPVQLMAFTSTILDYTRIQLAPPHPLFLPIGRNGQSFFHVPILRLSQKELRHGELNFWFEQQEFPGRQVRQFAELLAKKMGEAKQQKAKSIIQEVNALPNKEIKEIIKIWMSGAQRIFDCSYSVGLVLERFPPQTQSGPSARGRIFEVVKEELCGKHLKQFQKSKAIGLWINDAEGLLAEVLSCQKEKPDTPFACCTFHQTTPGGTDYTCLETQKTCNCLRASAAEANEKTVIYAPLNADGMQLGFIKLAYDEIVVLGDLEKKILEELSGCLAEHLRHSFIYTLNLEQLRFLPEIKNMFEETDNLKLLEFDQLDDMLARLTDTIIDITGIDHLAIGYITKNANQEKIIRFGHPRGWSSPARERHADLGINQGLAGLAVRIRRDVYLSPVEAGANVEGLESTIYVNEKIRRFVDIRKAPEYRSNPDFRNLAEYYLKTTEEKVHANFIFLIKYKDVVLGVINVEVTEKNWDRFIGLVYVHFFKTLADQLALFFYRLKLAKEDLHISRALEDLNKYAKVSPAAAYKAILFSLSEIFGVPQMRISAWDRKTGTFHFKPPKSSLEAVSIGFSLEKERKLSAANQALRLNDFCLLELEHRIEQQKTFYLYIPAIDEYTPTQTNSAVNNAFVDLRKKPDFVSYLGLALRERNQQSEVLELFSNKKNAFDELLIDHSFFESWISQIKLAMEFALEVHSRAPERQPPPLSPAKTFSIKTSGKTIPLLARNQLNLEFGLAGRGKSMEALKNQIAVIAQSECPTVLIQGELGTGKELVARAIHENSPRQEKPFVRVNCGALLEGVLEAELFGHEKWNIASTLTCKPGKFELAHNSTIFLDEIGELSANSQMRLLRVLQEKEFERLGGEETVRVDARIVVATNRNLSQKVEAGNFRDDLWYRINAIALQTVPLHQLIREDENNLLKIISHIIQERHQEKVTGITSDSYKRLLKHKFPGNVRELEGIINRALMFNRTPSALALNFIAEPHPQPNEPAAYRELAAIMFTDVVGFAALTQKNESLALKLIAEQRRILRALFPKYSGHEVETAGDAFFVKFSSALEAVCCAVAIQNTLCKRNRSLQKDRQIKIRIGMHIGDVIVQGKHVMGDVVNIAARLEPLAAPGGICISEDVARQIHNKIKLPLEELPKTKLKNIQLPVAVYAIKLS